MTRSEKQKDTPQFETIIYQLANLMIDTVKVTLHTLDDYHQLLDENSNQNRGDDIPF
jgi:predicted transcriptional regulator YheO